MKERANQLLRDFDPLTQTGLSVFSTDESKHTGDAYFLSSSVTASPFLEQGLSVRIGDDGKAEIVSVVDGGGISVRKECAVNKIGHCKWTVISLVLIVI
jgi:hypothetical protein